MAKSDNYLVIFYCVSAGQNGAELGSDEEEIVFLVFWVIDLHSNQVRFISGRERYKCVKGWFGLNQFGKEDANRTYIGRYGKT